MRILIFSALLVAVTHAAPRIESNNRRFENDLNFGYNFINPVDGEINQVIGEPTNENANSDIEQFADDSSDSFNIASAGTTNAGDEFGSDFDLNKDNAKLSGESVNRQDPTTPRQEQTDPPQTSPGEGTPTQGDTVPQDPRNPQNPQSPENIQAPTTTDPHVFQWFTSAPDPNAGSGCWNVSNEVCQICLPRASKCVEALHVSTTRGWRLCAKGRNGGADVGDKTCIKAPKPLGWY